MAGPFASPPLVGLRVSPLVVVPKKEADKFRMIHHLSYPKGASVNDDIDKALCSVSYTSFDKAVELVKINHKEVCPDTCEKEPLDCFKNALELYSDTEKKVKSCYEEFKDTQAGYLTKSEQCITELRRIADDVDIFHKRVTITNIAGSSVGIVGGITTIVGLALAPVTFGASLIVTAVGIGVATAGGLTGAGASIADTFNIKQKCKKVDEIIKELTDDMNKMTKLAQEIKKLIANLIYTSGLKEYNFTRLGTRGQFATAQITRLAKLVNLSTSASRGAQLAARGAQAATAVSGVFAALFLLVDIAFVVKGALDLKKGAKTDEAERIRGIANDLEAGLKEMLEGRNEDSDTQSILS
ncbi:apolipoprotein L6-like [Pelobates fuscus]|uniref:apolipoprotein L6-like n=1 Tax=Pelobates fuscus TaxID=191477 RepID=UPI002FE49BDD